MEIDDAGEAMEIWAPESDDIHALFCHYNALYFHDALAPACLVSWTSSPPMDRCASTCDYHPEGGCEIRLSEPLLKFRSAADLKNILLHEMIHAFLWTKNENRDHSDHGASFVALMDAINSSSLLDHQKPFDGYKINVCHDFPKCESCGDSIQRTMKGELSANDCIESVVHDESCGNPLCQWHRHKKLCSGSYIKKAQSSGYRAQITSSEGDLKLQKNKFKGIHYTRTIWRPREKEGMNGESDGKKAITLKSSGCNYSGADSQKELHFEDSKSIIPKDLGPAAAPDIPERVRAPMAKKKSLYTEIILKSHETEGMNGESDGKKAIIKNIGFNYSGDDSQRELDFEDSKSITPKDLSPAAAPDIPERMRALMTLRSHGKGGMNGESDGKKAIIKNSGFNYSGDDSQRELDFEDSKSIIPKYQGQAAAPDIRKRIRAPVPKKNKKSIYTGSGRKRRKSCKRKIEYDVIIKWLDVYADEEDDEDVEPLINKRTERRKKKKLLDNLIMVRAQEDEDFSPNDTSSCCGIEENSCADVSLIPIVMACEPEPGEIQAHTETQLVLYSSPSNVLDNHRDVNSQFGDLPPLKSPIRDDIVDISEG